MGKPVPSAASKVEFCQVLAIDAGDTIGLPHRQLLADTHSSGNKVLLHCLVHVRPRLSKSLVSQSARDDVVSTVVLCMVVNTWDRKAQGGFVAEVVQSNVFSCCRRKLSFDFAKGVTDPPDC